MNVIRSLFGLSAPVLPVTSGRNNKGGKRKTLVRVQEHIEQSKTGMDHYRDKRKIYLDNGHRKKLMVGRYRQLRKLRDKGGFVKSKVRSLYPDVPGGTFDLLFDEFDCYGAADESLAMFTVAVFLSTTPLASFEDEVDIGFSVFDMDGSGDINRQEFWMLMRATIASRNFRMRTQIRDLALKESGETVHSFLNLVGEFIIPAHPNFDLALTIYDTYLANGAPKELMEVSQNAKDRVSEHLEGVRRTEQNLSRDAFEGCHAEVIEHAQKEAFKKFQGNSGRMMHLSTELFDEVDADHSGTIMFDEYISWARKAKDNGTDVEDDLRNAL
ncbi:unnamed protein product [Chrysoparadoxa australica]